MVAKFVVWQPALTAKQHLTARLHSLSQLTFPRLAKVLRAALEKCSTWNTSERIADIQLYLRWQLIRVHFQMKLYMPPLEDDGLPFSWTREEDALWAMAEAMDGADSIIDKRSSSATYEIAQRLSEPLWWGSEFY